MDPAQETGYGSRWEVGGTDRTWPDEEAASCHLLQGKGRVEPRTREGKCDNNPALSHSTWTDINSHCFPQGLPVPPGAGDNLYRHHQQKDPVHGAGEGCSHTQWDPWCCV